MQPELENELTDMLDWFKSKLQEDGSGALAIAGSQTKSNTGSRSTSASLHEPKVSDAFPCDFSMRLSMPVLLERRTRMRGGGGWEVVNNE